MSQCLNIHVHYAFGLGSPEFRHWRSYAELFLDEPVYTWSCLLNWSPNDSLTEISSLFRGGADPTTLGPMVCFASDRDVIASRGRELIS